MRQHTRRRDGKIDESADFVREDVRGDLDRLAVEGCAIGIEVLRHEA